MREKVFRFLQRLARGPLSPVAYMADQCIIWLRYGVYRLKWMIQGAGLPDPEQQKLVCENVTFIFKSFQRQHMAKRLYRNIQKYYPGVRVIIADDSEKPLDLTGPNLEVIQLPFNSGLSRGLNQALARVQTPYTVRMDDDELLTPFSNFHGHLQFLMEHPEVDLVGVMPENLNTFEKPEQVAKAYFEQNMAHAVKRLRLPHGTRINSRYTVLGKVPNIFIVRTKGYRQIGYDDQIRMMDHNEFFFRAAGNLVSVLDMGSFVFHYHNRFWKRYQKYRSDVDGDRQYISWKYAMTRMREMQRMEAEAQQRTQS